MQNFILPFWIIYFDTIYHMIKKNHFVLPIILGLYISCNPVKKMQRSMQSAMASSTIVSSDGTKTDPFFTDLFKRYQQYFDSIIPRVKELNIQVIYTQIDRDKDNFPELTNYYYNVNPNRYFYPASTVKLPVAALALQR